MVNIMMNYLINVNLVVLIVKHVYLEKLGVSVHHVILQMAGYLKNYNVFVIIHIIHLEVIVLHVHHQIWYLMELLVLALVDIIN